VLDFQKSSKSAKWTRFFLVWSMAFLFCSFKIYQTL